MNRDSIIILALVVIALLGFPVVGLLVSDATPVSILHINATRAPIETATPQSAARVYLVPFRQAFAIGLAQPITRTNFSLYENGTDVFQLVSKQGAYTRLQTLDGKLNFWTLAENVATTPPTSAQYDFSVGGKSVRLAPQISYACLHEDTPPPVFSVCQQLPNLANAKLVAKITSGAVTMYLIQVENKNYFVPPESVLAIQ